MRYQVIYSNILIPVIGMNNINKNQNRKLRRNTIVFAILMVATQIASSIIYGTTFDINPGITSIPSVINTIGLAILVVAGFGLVFSYMKRLVWSGIGFTFFITAFCIQFYPLINDFWTKARINYSPTPIYYTDSRYELYLANANLPSAKLYGNCLANALKCALAVAIAFSSILGRAGHLECLLTAIFGAIGYELNRAVIANLAVDGFGTYSIFTYGGFMGLAMGLILKFKEDRTEGCSTSTHALNNASPFSVSYALLGSIIILALFPVLGYEIDVINNFNMFNLYVTPISIIIGMGASLIGAFIVSSLFNGNFIMRDIIHAPIAGGIVVGSASFFINNPVYALVAGFAGGALQSTIQNLFQRYSLKSKSVVSTISWSLFGIQGIIGGVFATGYKRIIDISPNANFIYTNSSVDFNPGYELLIAVISAGIGLGFGLLAGIIIYCVSGNKSDDHFSDKPYWITDDGLTYPKQKELEPQKPKVKEGKVAGDSGVIIPVSVKNQSIEKPQEEKQQHSEVLPLPDLGAIEQTEFQFEMDFSQASDYPQNFHAYL